MWCFRAFLHVNSTLPAVIRLSQALDSCSLASAAVAMFPVISQTAQRRAGLTRGYNEPGPPQQDHKGLDWQCCSMPLCWTLINHILRLLLQIFCNKQQRCSQRKNIGTKLNGENENHSLDADMVNVVLYPLTDTRRQTDGPNGCRETLSFYYWSNTIWANTLSINHLIFGVCPTVSLSSCHTANQGFRPWTDQELLDYQHRNYACLMNKSCLSDGWRSEHCKHRIFKGAVGGG